MGLGANLGDLGHVVEVAGETTRLLPVSERTAYLFGKPQADAPAAGRRTKAAQLDLFGDLAKVSAEEAAWSDQPAGRRTPRGGGPEHSEGFGEAGKKGPGL